MKQASSPAAKKTAKPAAKTTAARAIKPVAAAKAAKPVKPTEPAVASVAKARSAKAPVSKPVPAPEVKPKVKLVRDSFTMPRNDYDLIAQLKTRTLSLQRATKKSELLRAGLHALAALSDKQLLAALNKLQPLKAGRPKAG